MDFMGPNRLFHVGEEKEIVDALEGRHEVDGEPIKRRRRSGLHDQHDIGDVFWEIAAFRKYRLLGLLLLGRTFC